MVIYGTLFLPNLEVEAWPNMGAKQFSFSMEANGIGNKPNNEKGLGGTDLRPIDRRSSVYEVPKRPLVKARMHSQVVQAH